MRNGSLMVQLTTFCVCMLSMLYTYIIFHVIVGYKSSYLSIGSNPIVILLMDKMLHQLGNVQSTVLSEICTKNSCPRIDIAYLSSMIGVSRSISVRMSVLNQLKDTVNTFYIYTYFCEFSISTGTTTGCLNHQ